MCPGPDKSPRVFWFFWVPGTSPALCEHATSEGSEGCTEYAELNSVVPREHLQKWYLIKLSTNSCTLAPILTPPGVPKLRMLKHKIRNDKRRKFYCSDMSLLTPFLFLPFISLWCIYLTYTESSGKARGSSFKITSFLRKNLQSFPDTWIRVAFSRIVCRPVNFAADERIERAIGSAKNESGQCPPHRRIPEVHPQY